MQSKLPDAEIRSVGELSRFLKDKYARREDKHASPFIFRGLAKATWDLIPTVQRLDIWVKASLTGRRQLEQEMLEQFKRQARPHLNPPPAPTEDWEWLALAQHYGLPTRFLDWTEHAAAALFFAVELPNDHEPSAVWFSERPRNVTNISDKLFKIKEILLYEPPHISPRITVQRACFTAHPTDYIGIEYKWPCYHGILEIPAEARPSIRAELRTLGIHRASLFPELEGIATEIKRRHSGLEDE